MAPVKQVPGLKTLCLQSVQNYIKCSAHELMAVVSEISKRDPDLGCSFLRTSIAHLSNHLFESISYDLVDSVVEVLLHLLPSLIDALRGNYMACFRTDIFLVQMRCMVYLATLLLHPRVRRVDISSLPRVMKHMLLCDLRKMRGLRVLDLGAGSSGWEISEIEKFMLQGVCSMQHLQQLHLSIDCTDNIIRCLATHCPGLQVLDVPNSRSVTERCMPHLTQLQQLRYVQVTHTSVTQAGYTHLLTHLPRLVNMGRCEYMVDVMRALRILKPALRLTHVDCGKIDTATLDTLVCLCPALRHLGLQDAQELDISPLRALRLASLSLAHASLAHTKLLPFLQDYGQLTSLHLKGVHDIDEASLIQLSDACPGLRVLTLDTCACLARGAARYNRPHSRHYTQLQRLTYHGSCPDAHLRILLSSCLGLQHLSLGSSVLPSDEFLSQILRVNPLLELQEVRISHCHTLGMASVQALMRCPQLRVLLDLRSWYLLSESDFSQLKQEIADKNLDLIITNYSPPTTASSPY